MDSEYIDIITIYSFKDSIDQKYNIKKTIRESIEILFKHDITDFSLIQFVNSILDQDYRSIETSDLIDLDNIVSKINPDNIKIRKDQYADRVINTFIDMYISDPNLLDTTDLDIDLVKNFFTDWLDKGEIDRSDLSNLLTELELDLSVPDTLVVKDKVDIKRLVCQIKNISDTVNRNEIPYIELNQIIEDINKISDYSIPKINQSLTGIIVLSPDGYLNIPISLKSGNEIILTTRNYNLSIFTKEELIEILQHLDGYDCFDQLKTDIVKEISIYG